MYEPLHAMHYAEIDPYKNNISNQRLTIKMKFHLFGSVSTSLSTPYYGIQEISEFFLPLIWAEKCIQCNFHSIFEVHVTHPAHILQSILSRLLDKPKLKFSGLTTFNTKMTKIERLNLLWVVLTTHFAISHGDSGKETTTYMWLVITFFMYL